MMRVAVMFLLLHVLPIMMGLPFAQVRQVVPIQDNFGRDKEYGLHYANFKSHPNSYLKLHSDSVSVARVSTLQRCGIECLKSKSCFSFNIAVRQDNDGYFVCELLASDKYRKSEDFIFSDNFHHYSIVTPCLQDPCARIINAEKCIPEYEVNHYTCVCKFGWRGTNCEKPKDCKALKESGVNDSGIYNIFPTNQDPVPAYCDMLTAGGGWTVIQRRIDGSVDFYRDWQSYKQGFGNPAGEFWLGNDKIHNLTALGNTVLRVELEDWNGDVAYAMYNTFRVDHENRKYKLTVGDYSGNASDSLDYHDGMYFTTKDQDNDRKSSVNCAEDSTGAWWYKSCRYSNLNGRYLGNREDDWHGIIWYYWKDSKVSLKRSKMMIRHS